MNRGFSPRGQVLHLRHHPPLARPGVQRLVAQLLELPLRLPTRLPPLPNGFHRGRDRLLQTGILRQAEDVVDPLRFAPEHQLILGKIAVSAHRDPHLGPRLPQPPHDPLQFRQPPRGRPPRSDDRSRAHNRCSPQKMYRGR